MHWRRAALAARTRVRAPGAGTPVRPDLRHKCRSPLRCPGRPEPRRVRFRAVSGDNSRRRNRQVPDSRERVLRPVGAASARPAVVCGGPGRRCGRRPLRFCGGNLPAGFGLGASPHQLAGAGGQLGGRQSGRQPQGGEEPRRGLSPAAACDLRPDHTRNPSAARTAIGPRR